jgi:UDP-N-acetylglucosamine--N-acetylmuramyl-(pentapeptide) pyrophosphoryl-undecaprenol N-acetylglucosamine transferase
LKQKRVLIAAGGTGGHFYPGLVLACALRERGWQPLLLTRKADPALALLEREGLPAVEVDLKGLPRRLGPGLLLFGWKLAKALLLVDRVVKDFQPLAVVGMGSYLTFPAVLAARRRGIASAVHESNVPLGLANRLCLRLGAGLFRGLPGEANAGGELTGTPIRPALWKRGDARQARRTLGLQEERPTILAFGGSQGARGINRLVPEALSLCAARAGIQVLHLSGSNEAEEVRAAYAKAGIDALVLPYLDSMESAYAAADLVVCRSGASTLAELACQHKPAVLVPFPHAAAGHQESNARLLERCGAAVVVLEGSPPRRLAEALDDLLSSEARRQGMSEAYPKLGLPDPALTSGRLADAVETLSPL